MNKFGPKAQEKIEKSLHKFKHGDLKTGTGKKVTDRRQAVAIGIDEARRSGAKVPKKNS